MRILCLAAALCLLGCGGAMPHTTGMIAAAQVNAPAAASPRKVIDTVHLDMRVETVDAVAKQLPPAVDAVKGYIAESHLTQSQHSGSWTIRIPAEQVPRFLDVVRPWGVVQSERTTAEDVTEQFMDMTARLSVKRVEEDRLLKLLESGTGTLTDVLAVEKELQRVRQEIEQAQGRVRYLEEATEFATIHLRVHELFGVSWADGQPIGSQITTVVRSSVNLLLLVGRGLVLLAAALTPWVIVLAFPVVMSWRWFRRGRHRATSRASM